MKKLYLFALFLVMYEFTTYISNDMIMPGMLHVVNEFHTSISYVSTSFTVYILGNSILQLFLGPLSERFGKRNVILTGNIFFTIFTIFIIFAGNIHQFMLGRLLQGTGLAFIATGYALIHQSFNDKQSVKILALMGNVSLLAPLLGPLLGSMIIAALNWRYIFGLTAFLGLLAFIGLFKFTPINQDTPQNLDIRQIVKTYWQLIIMPKFIVGVICSSLAILPLISWIGLAPVIIMKTYGLGIFSYATYQLFTIGGLILSSVIMQFIAGRFSFYRLIMITNFIAFFGITIGFIFNININIVTFGLFLYSFGLGIFNNLIMRLLISIPDHPQSMTTSLMVFIQTITFACGMEFVNLLCERFGYSLFNFTLVSFIIACLSFLLIIFYANNNRHKKWE